MSRTSVGLIACCAVVVGVGAAQFFSHDASCDVDSGGFCTSDDCFTEPAGKYVVDDIASRLSNRADRISVDDVIALSTAGVPDEIVVNQVRAATELAPLSTSDILILHQHEVQPCVIAAWQKRARETAQATPAPPRVVPASHRHDAGCATTVGDSVDMLAPIAAVSALTIKRDVIANNVANAQSAAFKRGRVMLADLAYRHAAMPGSQDATSQLTAVGISVGQGATVQSVQIDFSQGPLVHTGGDLDLAIEGQGFFQVLDTSGQFLYTRAGNFAVNDQGTVVVGSSTVGRVLQPQIQIPLAATSITISADGIVTVTQAGNPLQQQIGQLQLAEFQNPQGLLRVGENMYCETISSGAVQLHNPGIGGVGRVRQRSLEGSNVVTVL